MVVIQTTRQIARRLLGAGGEAASRGLLLRHAAAARPCSQLQVKQAPEAEPEARPHDDGDSNVTFRYSDLSVTHAEPAQLRARPAASELQFGQIFTDHMLKVFYHKALGGWQRPSIIPFENISLHPAAKVLHYAIELFEGLKAYRGVDGRVRVFRIDKNMERMNLSARRSGLPTFVDDELARCIYRLLQVDQEWVPRDEGASLYIRPTLIGIDGALGVSSSESALLFTILCPVGSYFSGGPTSISLYADPAYTRAWPGGCGDRKVGSNYGPTIHVQRVAQAHGRQQALWLYGDDHQITEVGTMNLFMLYVNDEGRRVLATPPLNGLILPGITRLSILEMAREWNRFEVVERDITMREVVDLQRRGRILEMFGTGTACIVSPIHSIEYAGAEIAIPTMEQAAPVYGAVRDRILAIQYGHVAHPWAKVIDEALA